MWENTSEGDGRADEGVEFFVTTNSELEMAWRNALDFEIFCGVAGEFENFGGKVFEDGSKVDGGFGTDTHLVAGRVTEVTLYATAWELWSRVASVLVALF